MRRTLLLLALLAAGAVAVLAQQAEPPLPGEVPLQGVDVTVEGDQPLPDAGTDENGFLLGFIQGLLSAPGREVRIRGVSGVLSSTATIDEIVVSDAGGPWLRVTDVAIDWSRRALFLRRIQVNELTIGAIEYLRPALPPEATGPRLADAEATPFALPELPLAVRIEALDLGRLAIGEPVFGQAAELAAGGYLTLDGGALDADLALRRLDGPGGEFTLQAAFSNESRVLGLDLAFSEPPGGLVATALDIEGRPAIDLTLAGSGPLGALDLAFALAADGADIARGDVALREGAEGLAFSADFSGGLTPLLPAEYRDFFAGSTAVRLEGTSLAPGGLRLDRLEVAAQALALEGALELAPGGVLRRLDLEGRIGDPAAGAVTLPVPGGRTRIDAGTIAVQFGDGDRWDGRLALEGLTTGDIGFAAIELDMGGVAENLDDPASRLVTIHLEGLAGGLTAADPALATALGDRIDLFADIAIPAGAPTQIRQIEAAGAGLSLFAAGTLEDLVLRGRYAARIATLGPFSGLAGRALGGAIDVRATGDVLLASGGLDLDLDGTANDLRIGDPRIDPLLAGETRLEGRIARDEAGLRTDGFRLASPQVSIASTGAVSGEATDIGVEVRLADLGLVLDGATGAVTAEARATGAENAVEVALEAALPAGTLAGRPVRDLAVGFRGQVLDGDVAGALTGTGRVGEAEVALAGDLAVAGERRSLTGLAFRVGPNTVTGDLAQAGDGPVEGSLAVDAPDLALLAALAAAEAAGSAEATLTFGPGEAGQAVAVTARARDLVVAGTRVAGLALDAEVGDALGVPRAQGTLAAEGLVAGGIEVARLDARATPADAGATAFAADARLAAGTEASLSGTLARVPEGVAVTLDAASLSAEGIAARLLAPATLTVAGDTVALGPLALDLGGGRLDATGSIGAAVDLALTLDGVDLALANAVEPGLGLGGTVSGSARVTGPREAPQVAFDLAAAAVTAAALAEAGLPPLALAATGDTGASGGEALALDVMATAPGGLEARLAGAVPLVAGELALDLDLAALPLALLDPLAGEVGLDGTLAGTARATGSFEAPRVVFDLRGTAITAAPLRQAEVPPLALAATGEYGGDVLALRSTLSTPDALLAEVSGTVGLGDGAPDGSGTPGEAPAAAAPGDAAPADPGPGGANPDGAAPESAAPADPALEGVAPGGAAPEGVAPRGAAPADPAPEGVAPGGAAPEGAPPSGGTLDLDVVLSGLPLALLDPLAGAPGLAGTASGTARIGGSLGAPTVVFDIDAAGLSVAALREAGAPPLALAATGEADAASARFRAELGGGGLDAVAEGTLALGEGPLDVALDLAALPLALLDPFVGGPGLGGTVAGTARLGGTLAAPEVAFDLAGPALTLAPLAEAGLEPFRFEAAGATDAGRLELSALLEGDAGLRAEAAGAVPLGEGALDLTLDLTALPLRLAAPLAGAPGLEGTVTGNARVTGTLADPAVAFALRGEGIGTDALRGAGVPALAVEATGTGDAAALALDALLSGEGGLRAAARGTLPLAEGGPLNLAIDLGALPLALLDPFTGDLGLAGTLAGSARAMGTVSAPVATFDFRGTGVTFDALRAAAVAPLALEARGVTDGEGLTLDARLTGEGGLGATAAGSLPFGGDGPIDLALDLADLPLAIADPFAGNLGLGGRVTGTVRATGSLAAPSIAFAADGRDVSFDALRSAGAPPLAFAATGTTEAGILALDARLSGAGGLGATVTGDVPLTAEGALDLGVDIAALPLALADPFAGEPGLRGTLTGSARATGPLAAPRATFDLRGEDVSFAALAAAGVAPLALEARGEADGSRLAVEASLGGAGGLGARVAGTVPFAEGAPLDLAVDLAALPLAVLDPFAGNQGLRGTLTGTARATGSLAEPVARFDLSGAGLTAAPLQEAGIPPLGLQASGETRGERLDLTAVLTGPGGLRAEAAGAVPLGAGPGAGPLDLGIELGALPLALVDPLAGDIGLSGTVTGTARVGGRLDAPEASFSLAATGIGADPLRAFAVPPLAASASGSFAGSTLTLAQASLTGGGISASASGTVPLAGGGLAVDASGSLPLALANAAFGARTVQLGGEARFAIAARGSLAAPALTGSVTVDGASFVDPEANIRLTGISLAAALDGQTATITGFSAAGGFGGTVAGAGTIGLDPAAGFPTDLRISLDGFGYTDGTFLSTRLSGALALTGPIGAGGGTLAGTIDLGTVEISVAEALGAGGALPLEDVAHRGAPPGVLATVARARVEAAGGDAADGPAGPGLLLDLLVRAPSRIFVRGRGLDVELGGELRLLGPASDVQPVGQFGLIRGRLNVLGQRIDFEEGNLQLVGNLDPLVYFVARTATQEATAIVTVAGRVSAPQITFSSVPELPQDEVLALIIFNRTSQQLSPFQIAQLAAAAAELAGTGGNGLLSRFRGAVGLDDLDIVTGADGGAAVRAGRYIDENIYLDVQTGTGGDTRFSINLDITDDITARGTVGTDGNSTLGVYFQRDY